MHEFSIVSHLLTVVESEVHKRDASKVRAINLVLGERSGIVDDSLKFYFEMLAAGTLVEGAQINVRRTPMRFHCDACGSDYIPSVADFCCTTCGAMGRVVDDGSRMLIESIELET